MAVFIMIRFHADHICPHTERQELHITGNMHVHDDVMIWKLTPREEKRPMDLSHREQVIQTFDALLLFGTRC